MFPVIFEPAIAVIQAGLEYDPVVYTPLVTVFALLAVAALPDISIEYVPEVITDE